MEGQGAPENNQETARCLRAPCSEFWIIQMDDCKYLKMLMDNMPWKLEEEGHREVACLH
jgi:hypothetical protein